MVIFLVVAYIFVVGGLIGIVMATLPDECGLSCFNPNVIYDNWNVNWFGAYCLSIIMTIIALPISIFYWIYKLFTVGR